MNDRVEKTFIWTLSKLLGYFVVFMGFTLEAVLILFKDQFDLKVFLGSVAAATVLVVSKQTNDTFRVGKGE